MNRTVVALSLLTIFVVAPQFTQGQTKPAEPQIRVLLVTGQNNHNWKQTTPVLWQILIQSGVFTVDMACTPKSGANRADWDAFRPDFNEFNVVLMDYNGEPWPNEVEKSFEAFVSNGGGVVNIHAANNAFPDWEAWNYMIGLGWRDQNFGDRIYINERGEVVRVPKGEDNGAGHGRVHTWQITTRNPNHPIMRGMPEKWMHAEDELYHCQRGPAKDMDILDSAFSSTESGGTGKHEPMTWEVPYGKGRVITTVMGHYWGSDVKFECPDLLCMRCAGFQTLVCRACEYAATGEVKRIPIPPDFPTADQTSIRP